MLTNKKWNSVITTFVILKIINNSVTISINDKERQ